MPLEHVLKLVGIIGLHKMCEAAGTERHTFAVGSDLRISHLIPFIHRRKPHRCIEQPVVAAFENDVVVFAGKRTRQTQTRHDRFGAGIGKAHQLGSRHHLGDTFRDREFALGGEREHATDLHRFNGGRVNPRIGIAENGRTVPQAIVDVAVVVNVDQARAAAVLDVDGAFFAPIAEIGGHPQGQAG